MKRTSLAVLALITAVVVLAAIISYSGRRSEPSQPGSESFYPALADRVNDVESITIRGADEEFLIARHDRDWGLESKGGYPVMFEKVKETILGLADLKMIEPKTSNPDYYDRLGVEEPGAAGDSSGSTLLTLRDAEGQALASLIIGDTAGSSGPAARRYVRKADEAQAWLVEGSLQVGATAMNWVDRELLRLPRTRVRSVTINQPEGDRLHIHRESDSQRTFLVDDVPEGYELQRDNITDPIANAASYLRIEDVAPADEIDFADGEVTITEIRRLDGLLLTIELWPRDTGAWITLCASVEEPAAPPDDVAQDEQSEEAGVDAVVQEMEQMNDRFGGWAFMIGRSETESLTKRMADLIQKIEPEPDEAEETTDG